jgi:hypothetical protein
MSRLLLLSGLQKQKKEKGIRVTGAVSFAWCKYASLYLQFLAYATLIQKNPIK